MSGQLEKKKYTHYPKSLKLEVVESYLTGKSFISDLLREYNISDGGLIRRWVEKYQYEIRQKLAQEYVPLPIMTPENLEEDKLKALEAENKRLKDMLGSCNLKIDAFETLIELAEQTYRLPIRKNSAAKQSKSSGKGTEK